MNNTNIPPRKIKNKIYENQNLFVIKPLNIEIKIVCSNNIKPIARGWFICIKINLEIRVKEYKINCIISGDSLI